MVFCGEGGRKQGIGDWIEGKAKRARIEAAWLFVPIWAGDATELGKSVWRCRLGAG